MRADGVIIRGEVSGDFDAIRSVNELAFGRPDEAALVEKLRAATSCISLVAIVDQQIVGHIMFSPVTIQASAGRALALGPMAVMPDFQNLGIGSLLVAAGLDECRTADIAAVVVVGHANYYPRFGFSPAHEKGLSCKWPGVNEHFMVAELKAGALEKLSGRVEFHPEFDSV